MRTQNIFKEVNTVTGKIRRTKYGPKLCVYERSRRGNCEDRGTNFTIMPFSEVGAEYYLIKKTDPFINYGLAVIGKSNDNYWILLASEGNKPLQRLASPILLPNTDFDIISGPHTSLEDLRANNVAEFL